MYDTLGDTLSVRVGTLYWVSTFGEARCTLYWGTLLTERGVAHGMYCSLWVGCCRPTCCALGWCCGAVLECGALCGDAMRGSCGPLHRSGTLVCSGVPV